MKLKIGLKKIKYNENFAVLYKVLEQPENMRTMETFTSYNGFIIGASIAPRIYAHAIYVRGEWVWADHNVTAELDLTSKKADLLIARIKSAVKELNAQYATTPATDDEGWEVAE